jgi:hypothetical protein
LLSGRYASNSAPSVDADRFHQHEIVTNVDAINLRDQEVTAELTAASARTMTKHALIHRAQIRVA